MYLFVYLLVLLSVHPSKMYLVRLHFLISLSAASAATGLLGMMGNKGGAGIRMRIDDSSVCFVCAHLAAHREKVAERNADYHK